MSFGKEKLFSQVRGRSCAPDGHLNSRSRCIGLFKCKGAQTPLKDESGAPFSQKYNEWNVQRKAVFLIPKGLFHWIHNMWVDRSHIFDQKMGGTCSHHVKMHDSAHYLIFSNRHDCKACIPCWWLRAHLTKLTGIKWWSHPVRSKGIKVIQGTLRSLSACFDCLLLGRSPGLVQFQLS